MKESVPKTQENATSVGQGAFAHTGAQRPPSFSEHVRLVVRDDIVSGRLQPGQRLTELDIMGRTGVSRTPVREGIRLLEAEGLVICRRSRGAYVAHQLTAEEASVVYDCRLELEPFLTEVAAHRMTPARLDRIRSIAERFAEEAAGGASGARLGELDAEFHFEIYEASQSQVKDIFRSYWSKLQTQLSTRIYGEQRPLEFAADHAELVDALSRGDGWTARRVMAKHIQSGKDFLEQSYRRAGATDGVSE